MFRQQHMNALAKWIREDLRVPMDAHVRIVMTLGRLLRRDNPRFNPSRWLRATMEENTTHDKRILRGIRREEER